MALHGTDELIQTFYATQLLFLGTMTAYKASILFLYLRIFGFGAIRRYIQALLVLCLTYGITAFILTAFQCIPVRSLWGLGAAAWCINQNALQLARSVCALMINTVIILLPMPTIWKLQMPLRRRLWMLGIFVIGMM